MYFLLGKEHYCIFLALSKDLAPRSRTVSKLGGQKRGLDECKTRRKHAVFNEKIFHMEVFRTSLFNICIND